MTLLEAIPTTTATPAALPTLLLSAMVWVPALAALGLLFFPSRTELQRQRIRSFAIATSSPPSAPATTWASTASACRSCS